MAFKKEITVQIKDLLKQNPRGLSITEIVRVIKINRNTAGRYLENLMVSGQVEMRHFGMAKIYRLAQRVPLSAMLSISSELIMLLDGSLRVIYANEPLLQFLETTQNDLYGKNIEYIPCVTVCDDAFDTLKKHIKNGLAGKEWSGELSLKNKGVIFSCRIAPTVFEGGQRGVSMLFENITEWKRSEQRIQESERQFRQLAEHSMDIIVRVAPGGTCLYISPACQTILGLKPEEIIGRSVKEILHLDDGPLIAKIQTDLKKDHPVTTAELRFRHRNGHYVWIEASIHAIFDNRTGALIETYSIGREITDRKLAEEALRESEVRYRSFVQNFYGIAYRGRMDFVPVFFHGAVEEITGYTEKDFLAGKPTWNQIIHPDDVPVLQKSIHDIRTRPSFSAERDYRIVRRDGRARWIHEHIQNICDESGRPAFVQGALYDITDRKNAEEALRESEDRYRKLVEISPDAVLLHRDGKIIYLNPVALNLLGALDPNEIIGNNVLDFIQPDFRDAVRINIEKDLRGDITPPMELYMVRVDGKPIIVEGRGVKTFVEGKPAIQVAIRDITERKRAEEALCQSEATARALINAPTDSIVLLDSDGVILELNETAARRLGKPKDELIGILADTILPDDIARARRSIISQVLSKKTAIRFEDERDGKWYDTVAYPIHGDKGDVTKIAIIARDITDRWQIEENLRESEEKYRNLIERANDGICLIQDGVVKFCNRRITEFWGGSIYETLGRNFTDFVHPDAIPEIIDLYKRRMAGETVNSIYETKLKRKDGSVFYAEVNAGIVTYDGKPGDLIIIRDINDREKTE